MPVRRRKRRPGSSRKRSREKTHSKDGVDLTLIRWMLSLTPAERLEMLQCNIVSLMRLRGEKI